MSRELRAHLRAFALTDLFIEDLHWDRAPATHRTRILAEGCTLTPIAHKSGVIAYRCEAEDGGIPSYRTRAAIERAVAPMAAEHLLVYMDAARTTQIWRWVWRREGGVPSVAEHAYYAHQTGEAMVQKLAHLVLSLDREVGLLDVLGQVNQGLRKEGITKRFYEQFSVQRAAFLACIEGIGAPGDRDWYASLMLNRLMFIYFIQRKGFLDNDRDYLRTRLSRLQDERTRMGTAYTPFLSFYRYFLRRLFHEGLNQRPGEREPELEPLLGTVPYLNGGLFDVHVLEGDNLGIDIPDAAFERVFAFFDAWDWHLDNRPLSRDQEINPDVLGYIFEKYINQKQMGAYYTREDVTRYMARGAIIPRLLAGARAACPIAFEPEGPVWRLLRENPHRYIQPSLRVGIDLPLPGHIAAGLVDRAARRGWEGPADGPYGLAPEGTEGRSPESWRECVARRARSERLRKHLASGAVRDIDALLTLNLDIQRFAQDIIAEGEGAELLRALYREIEGIAILDPTCGSGAFNFAALSVLEPLYEACLVRMRAFCDDADRAEVARAGEVDRPARTAFPDFRAVLARMEQHTNRRYFIYKMIVINNLYGVDIMREAVEICKLRLFLTLMSQVEQVSEIEPLPDIDFNIRAGNTLVGFATGDEVARSILGVAGGNASEPSSRGIAQLRMDIFNELPTLDARAADIGRRFAAFRALQADSTVASAALGSAKAELHLALDALRDELDAHLTLAYGIDTPEREAWLARCQPFHWFVEFYAVLARGGFDVILGNPPWKEYAEVRKLYTVRGYLTERCGNLHGLCTERALALRASGGILSFIVQLPLVSSDRMASVRNLLRSGSRALHVATFDDRPGKLFEGLENCRSVIFISQDGARTAPDLLAVTGYQRWPSAGRTHLFALLEYAPVLAEPIYPNQFPKYGDGRAESVFRALKGRGTQPLAKSLQRHATPDCVFYQEATRYWVKATLGLPYYAKDGVEGAPAHGRTLHMETPTQAQALCALLNSSLFYMYFVAFSDCFHLSQGIVEHFPLAPGLLEDSALAALGTQLMRDLTANAERKTIRSAGHAITYAEYYGSRSKPLIDSIDELLSHRYGLDADETDLILTYDSKYRLGMDEVPERTALP